MSLQSDISIECELWSKLADLDALVERALEAARLEAGKTLFNGAEVSLLFCDDGRIQELNRDWRSLDKPTNVLSFPAAPADRLASA
ncbi:MAG: rRNA maturation RNase YbeY, partial [Pseudomonadota bacterium]